MCIYIHTHTYINKKHYICIDLYLDGQIPILRAVERQGVEVQDVGEGGVHGHGARAVPRAGLGVEDLFFFGFLVCVCVFYVCMSRGLPTQIKTQPPKHKSQHPKLDQTDPKTHRVELNFHREGPTPPETHTHLPTPTPAQHPKY